MSSFVHLHVHSEFSLLDGLSRLPDLCQYAAKCGMSALALTDHGSMYGTIKFSHAAQAAGLKPIFGCEVYQAARRMDQRDAQRDRHSYHLVLLAENQIGYQNLMELVTRAHLDGFYYKPRIDKELLAQHAEGLICLSACISGLVPSLLQEGQVAEARREAAWYRDLFGPDHFYLELQRHQGIEGIDALNEQLASLGRELGIPLVATNDVHYVRPEDARTQELLLAIQTQTTLADPNRMRMSGADYYLTTPDEMATLMAAYPEALANTLDIAERCNVEVGFTGYHLPQFDVPAPYTVEGYLRELAEEGLRRRYGEPSPEAWQRLNYELGVIHSMGFDDYFLINYDLVHWAKEEANMLVGPGRGSGASSLVGYALGITDLDPIALDLIFERFLNPGRVTMPDIDLDYPEDRRQEVIDYLVRRYGEDRTAQIATFGTMMARGAIRDVGRAQGVPLEEVDRVAKLIPAGPKQTIKAALEEVADLKALYESQPYVRRLIDDAIQLEGISRHFSTHACGVLITDKPLVHYTPLQRAPRGEGIVSQLCMADVEEIGLLKLDVLGLSTLTIIDRAFGWIEKTHGIALKLDDIPMDDPDTYALLASGDVTGVFQVESAGMRRVLKDMQASEFRDIMAILALYRPGPMEFISNYVDRKFGREQVSYLHPKLEPILRETYGIIVYQEQIIRLAQDLAGFSASEADLLRRAVGKKKAKALEQQRANFVQGAVAHEIPQAVAEQIFADIEKFANYGFNKGHSAAYAKITLQTAYLKAHYPAEFLAATLSVERGNLEKVTQFISELRRLGISVRPPSVNMSGVDFELEPVDCATPGERCALRGARELAVRFGLGAIKNVGDAPAEEIVQARGEVPFADAGDFARRVDLRKVNKRVLECLIRAGALDCLGDRADLLASIDQMMAVSQQVHHDLEIGQGTLFDMGGGSVKSELTLTRARQRLTDKERLADEKDLLGSYLANHPLDVLSRYRDDRLTPLSTIDVGRKGEHLTVAGTISALRVITTKKGEPMAFATVEDLTGSRELVVFPNLYRDAQGLLADTTVKLIEARVDQRDDDAKLIAESVASYAPPEGAQRRSTAASASGEVSGAPETAQVPDEADSAPSSGGLAAASMASEGCCLKVELPLDGDTQHAQSLAQQVIELLTAQQGQVPFSVLVRAPNGLVEVEFPDLRTSRTAAVERGLASLVGQGHFYWA
ncbi:MAG: DNA polymerase III subunit alpha [Anaerolineales bacterium]